MVDAENLVGVWRQCSTGFEWTSEEFFGILELWGGQAVHTGAAKGCSAGICPVHCVVSI